MNIKKDIRFRVYISFIGMCVFALMVIAKVVTIQVKEGKQLSMLADSLYTKLAVLQPERGNIFSEDGSLLSSSIPEFDIHIDFKSINKDTFDAYVKPLSKELSNLFKDKSASDYEFVLKKEFKEKNQYYFLKRKVKYDEYMALRSFPIFKKGKNKGGFLAESQTKRVNPFGLLANRTIGLYRENAQIVGLEKAYNAELSGEKGQRVEKKIAGGAWMPIDGSEIEAQNGQDVHTTIDVNTQDIAENALQRVLEKEEAPYGTCIVMEVKTGKIKALANLGRQTDGSYWEDYNYALRPLEPGSTFKLTSLMSAIDDGYVKIDDMISAQGGRARFGKQTMEDSHLGLGNLSIKEAFAHSSNVAIAKLIYNNYHNNPKQYYRHLEKLQINKPTGIDLKGEIKPRLRDADKQFQNIASLAWLAIGYEAMITPLRTCMIYNAVANNGKMMKPYLVNNISDYGIVQKTFEPEIVEEQICKPSTVEQLKEATFAVVESGTGKKLKNPHYTICGKTGTAQVADKGITYADGVYHGSFVGFFPKDNPQYTICVVIRTKKGASNYYGGQIALPIFQEIADRLYATNIKEHSDYKNILKDSLPQDNSFAIKNTSTNNFYTLCNKLNIPYAIVPGVSWLSNIQKNEKGEFVGNKLDVLASIVPDVQGMGLKDAVMILENSGLKVITKGKGRVVAQSLSAGNIYTRGQFISILLA